MATMKAASLRLSTEGADKVRNDFALVGRAGEKMGADITKGAKGIPPALRAIDTVAGDVKNSMEGLAGRAGTLGRALSSMGPVGAAAAVGVGAAAAALVALHGGAKSATDFLNEVYNASRQLNVSAEFLQEWRGAAVQVGIDAKSADQALAGLNVRLGELRLKGAASESGQLLTKFGFSAAEIKNMTTLQNALPIIADKLRDVGSAAEKAKLAEALQIGPLLPLLTQGSESIARMREEARRLGIVMDESLVGRGHELSASWAAASYALDIQFKRAMLDAAPAFVELAKGLAEVARWSSVVLDNFRSAQDKSLPGLLQRLKMVREERESIVAQAKRANLAEQGPTMPRKSPDVRFGGTDVPAQSLGGLGAAVVGRFQNSRIDALNKEEAELLAIIKDRNSFSGAGIGLGGVPGLGGLSAGAQSSKGRQLKAYKEIDGDSKAAAAAFAAFDKRMQEGATISRSVETPLERYRREAEDLKRAMDFGSIDPETYRRAMARATEQYDELARSQFEASNAGKLLDGVLRGQIKSVGDLGKALLALAQESALKRLYASLGSLFERGGLGSGSVGVGSHSNNILGAGGLGGKGDGGNGLGGLLKTGLSWLFGGGRAGGGPVEPGIFYRVNENTPRSEWFKPSVPGTIVTAAQMDRMTSGGGAGASMRFNYAPVIDARGADTAAVARLEAVLNSQQKQFAAMMQNFTPMVWSAVRDGRARMKIA